MEQAFLNRNISVLLWLLFPLFLACDKEDAPDCFRTSGEDISRQIEVPPFEELIVYGGIELFVEQGNVPKLRIETGENFVAEVSNEVVDNRLILRNSESCNLFREYDQTRIYVTVPDLNLLQNAGNRTIKSIGELHFPDIQLKSTKDHDGSGYTTGDFELELVSENIKVVGEDFSNFSLSGSTENLEVEISLGDGRVEAEKLVAQNIHVFHRGTNKMILNPQQVLIGEIRSTGDVISVNRPPLVEVETFYSGKLIFR